MKKTLLILFCAAASMAVSAQAWTAFPWGGSEAQPYTVPDAQIPSIDSLAFTATRPDKQAYGKIWWQFDQVNATTSAFAEDKDVTFFINPNTYSDTGGSDVRGWSTAGDGTLAMVRNNGNPQTTRVAGLGAFYTLNVTEAGNYSFYLRTRGITANDVAYTVTIHEHANIANVVATWNVNLTGIVWTLGTSSTDGSATYVADPLSARSGQGGSEWVELKDKGTLPVGKYVVKISNHNNGASPGNAGFGGFTLIKEVVTKAKANIIDANMFISNNVLNISGNEGVSTVSVYDISGKQMMVRTVSSASVQLPLNLKSGLYVVSLANANGTMTQKVVVK